MTREKEEQTKVQVTVSNEAHESEQNHEQNTSTKDKTEQVVCDQSEKSIPTVPEEGENQREGWSSPKKSCSPTSRKPKPLQGEVSVLSNSYSVLGEEEATGDDRASDDEVVVPQRVSHHEHDEELVSKAQSTTASTAAKGAAKVDVPLRQSLPRDSKTAHRVIPSSHILSARNLPRDQSTRNSHKRH